LGPERFNTLLGIIFLIIVLVSPGGLVGLWEKGVDRLRRRSEGGGAPRTTTPAGPEGGPEPTTVK
jgi:branched-chain amino acid transport system permease protein